MLHSIPDRTRLVIGLNTRGTFQRSVRERTQNVAIVAHTCNPSTQEAKAERKRRKARQGMLFSGRVLMCESSGCWYCF